MADDGVIWMPNVGLRSWADVPRWLGTITTLDRIYRYLYLDLKTEIAFSITWIWRQIIYDYIFIKGNILYWRIKNSSQVKGSQDKINKLPYTAPIL